MAYPKRVYGPPSVLPSWMRVLERRNDRQDVKLGGHGEPTDRQDVRHGDKQTVEDVHQPRRFHCMRTAAWRAQLLATSRLTKLNLSIRHSTSVGAGRCATDKHNLASSGCLVPLGDRQRPACPTIIIASHRVEHLPRFESIFEGECKLLLRRTRCGPASVCWQTHRGPSTPNIFPPFP